MALFWTILVIGFVVLEAATTQFVCIWFAGGAFAALISAICTDSIWIQTFVFVVVSTILLIFTRKIIKTLKTKHPIKTNTDALIGEKGVVVDAISNDDAEGSIKIRGMIWSARSEDGSKIESGTHVCVKEIDGVKLIVLADKKED